jgi:hypothetical protein
MNGSHVSGSGVVFSVTTDTIPAGPIVSGVPPTPAVTGTFGVNPISLPNIYDNGYYRASFRTGTIANPGPPTFPLGQPAILLAVSPGKAYLLTEGVSTSAPHGGVYILEQ